MQGRSRLAPLRGVVASVAPIRARGVGSAGMSRSGRESAEGLRGVVLELVLFSVGLVAGEETKYV